MIRLMLATYSKQERECLAELLEKCQHSIECASKCTQNPIRCRECKHRHLCTDLLSAAVFAKDYTPPTND